MNFYLQTQILNMKMAVKNFEQACIATAQKDDGKIDPEEEKILKRIHAASDKFIKELNKL